MCRLPSLRCLSATLTSRGWGYTPTGIVGEGCKYISLPVTPLVCVVRVLQFVMLDEAVLVVLCVLKAPIQPEETGQHA